MSETSEIPAVPVAIKKNTEVGKAPEYTVEPSIVERKNFSPEELGLINTRIQSLQDNATSNLKKHDAKLILTLENQDKISKELSEEGAGTEKVLNKANVERIIDENDFEKNTTTPATPATPIETAGTAVLTGVMGAEGAGEIQEKIKKIGGLPRLLNKIKHMFLAFWSGSELSFEQDEIYKSDIVPGLREMGIDVSDDPKMGKIVLDKLSGLGITLDMGKLFFSFIQNPTAQKEEIPKNFRAVFEAGRINYQDLKKAKRINPDPTVAIQQILTFEVTDTPVVVAPPVAPTPESAAAAAEGGPIKFTDAGKETVIEASPESTTSFKNIRKTAETILGKDTLKIEDKIKEAYKGTIETDSKQKGEAVLKAVAIELVKNIRNTTAVFGSSIESATKEGQPEISLKDDFFTVDLVQAIDTKLHTYLPLAFKALSARVVSTVNDKFKTPSPLIEGTDEANTYKKTREAILKSVLGNGIETGQENAAKFPEKIKNGYAEVFRDILKQAEKLNNINSSSINNALLIAYQAKSPLELS